MSNPNPLHDPENTYPEDDTTSVEETPADHWQKVKDSFSLLQAQVADLQDLINQKPIHFNHDL